MFSILPDEINVGFLDKVTGSDLINLCRTDKYFERLCDDESFWEKRVRSDYDIDNKPEDLSWQKLYLGLSNEHIKRIAIELYNTKKGYILANRNEKVSDLVMRGELLIPSSFFITIRFINREKRIVHHTTIGLDNTPVRTIWNTLDSISYISWRPVLGRGRIGEMEHDAFISNNVSPLI